MRRAFKIFIVMALWAPAVVMVGAYANGISSDDFSGFDMGAKASAITFTFDSPSLGVPAKPTGELNFAYSEASLQSGPAAYGLGSILWPGQVVAALPPFLQGIVEEQSGGQFKFPFTLPVYPIRAESFYPQGPTSASLDGGTMHMNSATKEKSAEGVAYLNKFSMPVLGDMGNQSSFSTLGFDQDGAVAIAESSANDVSLAGGAIKIDSVVSRLTARSDGEKGTVAGTTTVAGVTVGGIAAVVDSAGVHVAGQNSSTAAQQQSLNQVLNQLGVTMQLSVPVDTKAGPKASRALGGLLVSIKSSTLEPLIAALPAQLQNEFRSRLTLDQVIAVQIAPAAVSAGAAKSIAFEPPPILGPTTPDDGSSSGDGSVLGGAETSGGDEGAGLAPSDSGSGVPSGGGVPVALAPVKSDFNGVPLWLTILLVLLALTASKPLTMFADRIFAARGAAGACPDGRD